MAFPFSDISSGRVLLFDGALGTELLRRGVTIGDSAESLNLDDPEAVRRVHLDYFEAGADVVSTNSFGANRLKLSDFGLEGKAPELNRAAAAIAVGARPAGRFVAGSMGPTGRLLRPHGEFPEEEFEAAFAEQAEALAAGGADFLILETHYDLREALCGLRAAVKAVNLPVLVTMTFKRTPRGFFTFMGDTPAACLRALEDAGASAVGANCSLGPEDMLELVRVMRPLTGLPVMAQPNAGQPVVAADGSFAYLETPEDFARHVPGLLEAGANIIGGCCGTTPEHIRLMSACLGGRRKAG